jgi:hypothetical protein
MLAASSAGRTRNIGRVGSTNQKLGNARRSNFAALGAMQAGGLLDEQGYLKEEFNADLDQN